MSNTYEDTMYDGIVGSQKKIKPVPTKAGTLGFESVRYIMTWYADEDNGSWTKTDTQTMLDHMLEWADERGLDTKYQATHVSYYRSVLKQNGRISY